MSSAHVRFCMVASFAAAPASCARPRRPESDHQGKSYEVVSRNPDGTVTVMDLATGLNLRCPGTRGGVPDEIDIYRAVPGLRYVELSPAVHVSNLEQPRAFVVAVADFLAA